MDGVKVTLAPLKVIYSEENEETSGRLVPLPGFKIEIGLSAAYLICLELTSGYQREGRRGIGQY
jgi:hypothetical protein